MLFLLLWFLRKLGLFLFYLIIFLFFFWIKNIGNTYFLPSIKLFPQLLFYFCQQGRLSHQILAGMFPFTFSFFLGQADCILILQLCLFPLKFSYFHCIVVLAFYLCVCLLLHEFYSFLGKLGFLFWIKTHLLLRFLFHYFSLVNSSLLSIIMMFLLVLICLWTCFLGKMVLLF